MVRLVLILVIGVIGSGFRILLLVSRCLLILCGVIILGMVMDVWIVVLRGLC